VPPAAPPRGGVLRRVLLICTLAGLAGGAYVFDHLGVYLSREDPLVKADAVYILAGTRMLRPLEGADLVLAGYAPLLVMTRDTSDPAMPIVAERGHVIEADVERARDIFANMGIPRDRILIPPRPHDSTADEAITLRELALAHGWRRVIVVTSTFHLTRAGFAMRRELAGTNVEVVMRKSRYDPSVPEHWWRGRAEARWVMSELPKLIAYRFGMRA